MLVPEYDPEAQDVTQQGVKHRVALLFACLAIIDLHLV